MTRKIGTSSRLRPMLGTFVAVEVEIGEGADASTAIEAAYCAIERVDRLMHPTRAGSDLERLATAPLGTATQVHPWTHAVLELARELNRQSAGAFDPCLPVAPGRMRDVLLADAGVTCGARVAIDLGGIAKGFAVDRAVEALIDHGALAGMVNAGGDLRVFGIEARSIELRTPAGALRVELRDAALAVSARRGAGSPPEHRGYYHGSSGAQVDGSFVAVSAPSAAAADALCKCAMLCEPGLLGRLLESHGARLIYGT